MSECVVRMEMPENCGECSFRSDGWCYGIREFDPQPGPLDFEKRPSWCPIICQLPEGHGELIDRSKLFDWYTGQRTKYPVKHDSPQFGKMMMYEIFGEIDDAPTIVPAERSGE